MIFNTFHYFYIGTTFLITLINLKAMNKNAYLDTLVRYHIVKHKDSMTNATKVLLTLDIIYVFCSIMFFLVAAIMGNVLSFIVFLAILISHFVGYISSDLSDKNKGKLIKIALKNTSTPKSVLDFKVDSHLLLDKDLNYLLAEGQQSKKLKINKINQILTLIGFKNIESKDKYFTLFSELMLFVYAIDDELIDADNPLINQYILEKIMLLSTVMNILNNEKLTTALKTKEGKEELKGLVDSMKTLNVEIRKITNYIKKEKITFTKAENSAELIEQLNEIRSMKEFVDLVK